MSTAILKKLQNLLYIGVDPSDSLHEIRQVLLVNIIVATISIFLLILAAFLFLYAPVMSVMLPVYIVFSWMVFVLHFYKKYLAARLYFWGISWVIIFLTSLVAGKDGNLHWFWLFSLVLALFIFDRREKVFMSLCVIFPLIGFIAFEYTSFLEPYQLLTPEQAHLTSYIVNGGLIIYALFIGFFCYYITNNSEKKLVEEQDQSEKLLLNILPEAIVK